MHFVGRRRERERLGARLDSLPLGHGGVVLISGEPGVGKTSLARELARDAGDRSMLVLTAACFEGESQAPYQLWVELLGPRATAAGPEGLRHELGGSASAIAALIPAAAAALPDAVAAPPLAADDERRRLVAAVTAWLGHLAAATPTVVVLEDLQWADADSLDLLRRVARMAATNPLLLVGTHRSAGAEPLLDLLAYLFRETEVQRVQLGGFTVDEVGEFLSAATGDALPMALVNAIHQETTGNPFFVREVLNHLVEEEKISRQGGRWTTDTSIAELGIPDGVRLVVRQRVSRLPDRARDVLAAAAGMTAGFDAPLLAAVSATPEVLVVEGLDQSVAAGLLCVVDARRGHYDFAHAIVRHAVYEELTPAERRQLHARIAAALEQGPEPSSRAAELAAQHYRAGSPDGVRWCVVAAHAARATHAPQQAVRFLRMAAEIAGAEDAIHGVQATQAGARLLADLAVAEAEALDLDAGATTAATALDRLVDTGTDLASILAFVVTVARSLKESGAPTPAWLPLVERGLALVGDHRDLAWAQLSLLVSPMAPMAEGGVHVGRWIGHDPEVVRIAAAAGTEDDHARTIEAWDRRSRDETAAVVALARSWRSPPAVLRAYEAANRSYLFRHGDLHETASLMEELLNAGVRWGSAAAQGEALTQLALCHALMGRPEQAREELDQARAIVEPLGALHRQHLAVNVTHAIIVGYLSVHDVQATQAGAGDWEAWGERAAKLVAQPQLSRAAPLGLIVAGLGAIAFAMAPDPDRAAALVDPLTALLERCEPTDYGATGSLWMAIAACWELRRADLAVRHDALVTRMQDAGLPAGPWTSWALPRARLATLAGDPDRAGELFTVAEAELEAAGHAALAGRARLDAGRPEWPERRGGGAGHQRGDNPAGPLTPRELEVLGLIAAGHTSQEIAALIHVSVPTVNRHVANVYLKIGARNRASATAYAVSHGLA